MLAATIHITTIAVIIIVVAKNSAEESSKDTNMDRKYINIHGFPHAPASDEKIGRRQTQGESECGLAAAKEIVRSQMPAAVCTIRTGVRRFRPGIREHPQRRDLLTLPVIAIFISLKC